MSSATPVVGTPGVVSLESLLQKYNLPEGTNADAMARVMSRLSELPVSSPRRPAAAEPPGWLGTEPRHGVLSSATTVDASARRNQMRFTTGGEPAARVSWSPASPGGTAKRVSSSRSHSAGGGLHVNGGQSPGTPNGDPLALIQDLYGDDVDEEVRGTARRELSAAGYGSPLAVGATTNTGGRTTPNGAASVARQNANAQNECQNVRPNAAAPTSSSNKPTTLITSKEQLGKLGELKYEARTATQRARRAERALQLKDQELEETKAKYASLARERSALSARLSSSTSVSSTSRTAGTNPFGGNASNGSYAFAPPSTNANFHRASTGGMAGGDASYYAVSNVSHPKSPFSQTPRKPSGEPLSMSSRWHEWEHEARRGDKRLGMLMRGYKKIESEVGGFRESARVARESVAFSEDELEATKAALDELRGNFTAAKELLNEGLEARDELELQLRAEKKKNSNLYPTIDELRTQSVALSAETETLREKNAELLRRSVKRDHKIDALSKKLVLTQDKLEESTSALGKAEDELTKTHEQVRPWAFHQIPPPCLPI